MSLVLKRAERFAPSTWFRTKQGTLFVTCPNGHTASLIDHSVSSDGEVTPSLVCPEDSCDFHEFVRLNGLEVVG